uniref:Uncharacterized protein n=1 Tax=Meloidogyne enterolobii TaxID=390850 RepID=A0A6V7VTD2_MELEN|nr:unnamed protein product [Meloidogyne enterolobii]
MKLDLPLNIWMDILALLTRQEIASLAEEFSDRRFCTILACYLHRYGLITLPTLRFDCSTYGARRQSAPTIHAWHGRGWDSELPLAEAPLPVNIRNFTSLEICYFDSKVAQFVQRMSPIFNNVVINLVSDSKVGGTKKINNKKQFEVLRHLLPSINSIEGIRIEDLKMLPELNSKFPTTFFDIKVLQLVNPNLAVSSNNIQKLPSTPTAARQRWNVLVNSSNFPNRIKRKSVDSANLNNENVDILSLILNWLSTKRKDGEPRMLQLRRSSDANNNNKLEESSVIEFINAIKKNFVESKEPVSYFIRMREHNCIENISNFKLTNELTNECLEMNKIKNEKGGALISRYLINEIKDEQWWRQREEKAIKWRYASRLRRIALLHYLK